MARVHETAVVDPGAKLAEDVEIGPFAVIGEGVELAAGVVVGAHAVLGGRTSVGCRTRIHAGALLGGEPQIQGGRGEATTLAIGEDCEIRELAVVHAGSPGSGGGTRIGDHSYLMNNVHVGHDCRFGAHCVLASYAALAGHVEIEDHAGLGAFSGVHQFVRIGESAFTAAGSRVSKGVPPYALVAGDRARLVGLNRTGLERRGLPPEARAALKHAFHLLFYAKLRLAPALERAQRECGGGAEVERLLRFLRESERGFVRPA